MILTDEEVAERFVLTQIRDKETLEIKARYSDAVKVIKETYSELAEGAE